MNNDKTKTIRPFVVKDLVRMIMSKKNMAFDDALALAQQLGYAERNPSAEVVGR